jgi:hypothetical protein
MPGRTRTFRGAGIPGIALAALVLLASCGASADRDVGDQVNGAIAEPLANEPAEPSLPEADDSQSEAALRDAVLASSLALFLAFEAEPGAQSMTNQDGSLTLAWDESADFATGAGVYTMTMREFTADNEDLPGATYSGYVLTGTVVMGSDDGVTIRTRMDLELSHPRQGAFPVRSIELSLEQSADSVSQPDGYVRINGKEKSVSRLAGAFQITD